MDVLDTATVDRLLTTTRAFRKALDLQRPVPQYVIEECLALALHAPNAGNEQPWRWVVVTNDDTRAALAELYARSLAEYLERQANVDGASPEGRLLDSVRWLVAHLHQVPVHVIPCLRGRSSLDGSNQAAASFYGSILPAVWSFQLALRSRGLGSTFTSSHLHLEHEAAELLGIPDDYVQVALLPVAYVRAHARPGPRRRVTEVTSWERFRENTP